MTRVLARLVDALLEATIVGSWSRLGYQARNRLYRWPALDSYPMQGKVVLLSGATSAIGQATAKVLVGQGARLWLLVRDEGKGELVRDELVAMTGNKDVRIVVADITDFDQVREAAARVSASESSLDVLIQLTGVLSPTRTETDAGVELTLATHLLGPWLLTKELRPLLAAADPGRVLWMSSGGMYAQRLELDGLEMAASGYKGATAYARAKRAQVVLARVLSREYADEGIVVHALHPGWVDTPILADSLPGFYRIVRRILRTAQQGADTQTWLAAAAEPARTSGDFWFDRRRRRDVYLPWTRVDSDQANRLIPWMNDRIAAADARAAGASRV